MPKVGGAGRKGRRAVEEEAEQSSTALIVCVDRGNGRRMPSERSARNDAEWHWCREEMKSSFR